MRVFLTGATGFVGGAVARRLAAEGHEVRALARDPSRAGHLSVPGIVLHRGDITDPGTLRRPMDGVDAVFHIAGWYKVGVADAASAHAINVEGTRNVLQTMADLGIPKGVYTSSVAIYSDTHGRVVDETYRFEGRHLSHYDRSKAEAHRVAMSFAAAGLPLVIVQPGAVYGPGDTSSLGTSFRRLAEGRLPPLPARTAFCWTFVDDVVSGHLLALQNGTPGRSYLLCGPAHTFVEAIEVAARIMQVRPPRLRVPPWVLKMASVPAGLIGRVTTLPPEFTAEGLRVLAGVTYLGSSMRARQELGWRARPLEDGLRDTIRALGLQPRGSM